MSAEESIIGEHGVVAQGNGAYPRTFHFWQDGRANRKLKRKYQEGCGG